MSFESVVADALGLGSVNDGRWLVVQNGVVKTLAISITASDCDAVIEMLNQFADADLPVPLVSISPARGFTVWVVLNSAIPVAEARGVLSGLCSRYLGALKPDRITLHTDEIDAVAATSDELRWSAFIEPTMITMFKDETWLEMPPNLEQQALLVSRNQPAQIDELKKLVYQGLATVSQVDRDTTISQSNHPSPRAFLMSVMNDEAVAMRDRIAAAAALLPYIEQK